MKRLFNIILAFDRKCGIGSSHLVGLPWSIGEDLRHFKAVTSRRVADRQNVLLMGRKTADTFRDPLPNRINYVVTSQKEYRVDEGFYSKESFLDAVVDVIKGQHDQRQWGDIYLIGGAQLVKTSLEYSNLVNDVFITQLDGDYNCDLVCPELDLFVKERCDPLLDIKPPQLVYDRKVDKTIMAQFRHYRARSDLSSEQSYLNVLTQLVLQPSRETRNGLTRSCFGTHLEFNLKEGFPALTTKRLFWKGVVNELLFFLGGCTDNKWLTDRGVHIWDGNTTKEFLEKVSLPYQEGSLGPVYGYQFRYYGQPYEGKDQPPKYDVKRDQFAEVVHLLLNDPHSRRILMTSYNYAQVKEGVLPPCHSIVLQFYVDNDFSVSCQMYQRSADWFLGVPFNIASNALLTHILVNYLNHHLGEKRYSVGRLLMTFGDYHLYENHVVAALTQAGRWPKSYPELEIREPINEISPEYFLSLSADNFQLVDYRPDKTIKAEMVA